MLYWRFLFGGTMDLTRDWIWDIETYKSAFTFSIIRADGEHSKVFEVSRRMNEIDRVFKCIDFLRENNCRMVGFNSIGFDYPILHELLIKRNSLPDAGKTIAVMIHKLAQKQIESFKDGFGHSIKPEDEFVKQVDLYRIWHFNNKARSTGLKMLEFNMRLNNIEDLPFAIEANLTDSEIDKLKQYNQHDVNCTLAFYKESISQISFRDDLSVKLGKDFTNADDTKIGAEYFQMKLEEQGVKLYRYENGKRVLNQTKRPKIKLSECLFDYYDFKRPEFIAVHEWFARQVITETKGVFSDLDEASLGDVAKYAELEQKKIRFKGVPTEKDIVLFMKEHPLGWIEEQELKATEYLFDSEGNHVMYQPLDDDGNPKGKPKKQRVTKKSYWGCWREATTLNIIVDGFRFDFGLGGIHGSLSNKIAKETPKYLIRDADVSSMYPNIAISNRVYPEHLGETFCDIYSDMYEQRKSFAKGTPENAMLKLALNGTYGKSNDKYSVFYDPKFTMSITINGQLSLCLLAEKLLEIPELKIIQVNTDGITVACPREHEEQYKSICKLWEKQVKLDLEFADYSKMFIRDVNSYIALYTNGKIKRKGAYQYEDLGWHQNQGGLIIPMAAEANMLTGVDIREYVKKHTNKFDFMLRTKVPRSSKLVIVDESGVEKQQQNICRYYISKKGGKLVKIMPPLEGDTEDRRLGIDTDWLVSTCNNIVDFKWDIDYEYYVSEAEKLVIYGTKQ